MGYEMLVGLEVTDEARYRSYRRFMVPILESYGGSFGYDFRVSQVLISQGEAGINRVFTIRFPDEETKNLFFTDERYREVRARHFDGAVGSTAILAAYEVPA